LVYLSAPEDMRCVRPLPSSFMPKKLPVAPNTVLYELTVYGSLSGDPVGDERYGEHQRRMEINLMIQLPRAGMRPAEVREFAKIWMDFHYI
jgi:hypothetical protein